MEHSMISSEPQVAPSEFPIKSRRNASQNAYEALLFPILSGEYETGDSLPPERTLSASLGVSRPVLRIALARLEQEGLLSIKQGGKTRILDYRLHGGVSLLSPLARAGSKENRQQVILDILEMRAALAGDVAAACALRASTGVKKALFDVAEEMGTSAARREVTLRFWDWVLRGSANIAYQLSYNSLTRVMGASWGEVEAFIRPEFQDLQSYTDIAKAVDAGDAQAAALAAKRLCESTVVRAEGAS